MAVSIKSYGYTTNSITVYLDGLSNGYAANNRVANWYVSTDGSNYTLKLQQNLYGTDSSYDVTNTLYEPAVLTGLSPSTGYYVRCIISGIIGSSNVTVDYKGQLYTSDDTPIIQSFYAEQTTFGSLEVQCHWLVTNYVSWAATWSLSIDGHLLYNNQSLNAFPDGITIDVDSYKTYTLVFTVTNGSKTVSSEWDVVVRRNISTTKPDPPYLIKRVNGGLHLGWSGSFTSGDCLFLRYRVYGETTWTIPGLVEPSLVDYWELNDLKCATTYELQYQLYNNGKTSEWSDSSICSTAPSNGVYQMLFPSRNENTCTIYLYRDIEVSSYTFTKAIFTIEGLEGSTYYSTQTISYADIISSSSSQLLSQVVPSGYYKCSVCVYYTANNIDLYPVDDDGNLVSQSMSYYLILPPFLMTRAAVADTDHKAQLYLGWSEIPTGIVNLALRYRKSGGSWATYDVKINPHSTDTSVLLDGLEFATTYEVLYWGYKSGSSRPTCLSGTSICTTSPDNRLLEDSSFNIGMPQSNQIRVSQYSTTTNYTFTAAKITTTESDGTMINADGLASNTAYFTPGNPTSIYYSNLAGGTYTVNIYVYYTVNGVDLYPVDTLGNPLWITKTFTVERQDVSAPTNLSVSNRVNGGCTLSWNQVDGATGYKVTAATSYNSNIVFTHNINASTSCNITGLAPGLTHTLSVSAYDSTGTYSKEATYSFTTNPTYVEIGATNVSNQASNKMLSVNWNLQNTNSAYTYIYVDLYNSNGVLLSDGNAITTTPRTFIVEPGTYYIKARVVLQNPNITSTDNYQWLQWMKADGSGYEAIQEIVIRKDIEKFVWTQQYNLSTGGTGTICPQAYIPVDANGFHPCTAEEWRRFANKINEVRIWARNDLGKTVTGGEIDTSWIKSGEDFMTHYNIAVTAIKQIPGVGGNLNAITEGTQLTSSLFTFIASELNAGIENLG